MKEILIKEWAKTDRIKAITSREERLRPDQYPSVTTLGCGHLFPFVAIPKETAEREFVYVDLNGKEVNSAIGTIAPWNMSWEMGQFRADVMTGKMSPELKWLEKTGNKNIYILPRYGSNNFEALSILYHLLPLKILKRFNLPVLSSGSWPAMGFLGREINLLPINFEERLCRAFVHHVWPLLNGQSRSSAFRKNEPLNLLAHSLNFWLPFAYQMAEERLADVPRLKLEGQEDKRKLKYYQDANHADLVSIERPRYSAHVWHGESEAWDATKHLIEVADKKGNLRALIDVINSGRCEDDFSNEWSYAREDFERKLYSKRSKVKISFVQLDETIPVHGFESEIHESLFWENFFAVLNKKEKQVVICLRNGATSLSEIASDMGYANHSPVSKALNNIRKKAERFI